MTDEIEENLRLWHGWWNKQIVQGWQRKMCWQHQWGLHCCVVINVLSVYTCNLLDSVQFYLILLVFLENHIRDIVSSVYLVFKHWKQFYLWDYLVWTSLVWLYNLFYCSFTLQLRIVFQCRSLIPTPLPYPQVSVSTSTLSLFFKGISYSCSGHMIMVLYTHNSAYEMFHTCWPLILRN